MTKEEFDASVNDAIAVRMRRGDLDAWREEAEIARQCVEDARRALASAERDADLMMRRVSDCEVALASAEARLAGRRRDDR
jgi:hypothetical protein